MEKITKEELLEKLGDEALNEEDLEKVAGGDESGECPPGCVFSGSSCFCTH